MNRTWMNSTSMRLYLVSLGVFCLLLAMPAAGRAQTSDLSGEVRDQSQALIPGANLKVTQTATGIEEEIQTNRRGAYFFSLQPGTYSMTVSAKGFKTIQRDDIVLQVGQPARLDYMLRVGDEQEISVHAADEVLQQSPSVGMTITENEIARLPVNGVNGRNYTSLVLLAPGVSDVSVAGGDGTISGTNLYSVNGQRNQDNHYTLDGVDNNFFHKQSPGLSPPMDSMKEFRVATNNSAELGRSAGANVALVTKSGGRQLHGAVYEYSRQAFFDANDWFNNHSGIAKLPFHYNHFGVNVGGPVFIPRLLDARKHMFWFFSYEGFSKRQSQAVQSNVPTAAERTGDFSGLKSIALFDPASSTHAPFAGNIIPANRLDPVALAYLNAFVPLPNIASATTGKTNYINNTPQRNDRQMFVGRLDEHLNARNNIFLRVLHQDATQTTPQALPTYSQETGFSGYNLALGWDFIATARDLVQVRLGYNNPHGPDVTRNNLGIGRDAFFAQTGIQIFAAVSPYNVLPTISAQDFTLSETGGTSRDNVYEANILYSRSIGTSLIKSGFTFQPRHYYHDATSPTSGTATYTTALSGSGTASFLLGYPTSVDRGLGNADVDASQNFYAFFGTYNRRIGQRLTAEVGLRYEFYLPAHDKLDRLGTLWVHNDPTSGSVTGTLLWAGVNPLPDPVTGAVNQPPNQAGFGRGLAQTNIGNLMPRVGLAYQLGGHTVVRAGYGIYDNTTAFQEVQDERKFYPYNFDQNIVTNTGKVADTTLRSTGPSFSSTATLSGYAQDPAKKTPYSQQYNLTIQGELPGRVVAQVAYVGSNNKRQIGYEPFNTAPLPDPNRADVATLDARRLLPQFGNVYMGANRYKSNYNALQVAAHKRYRKGLEFQANYTWSRALDNQSSLGEIKTQDPFNPGPDYSRSSFDLTHIFNLSFVYDLPVGRGRWLGTRMPRLADAFVGGWSIESINRYETGPPVNVTLGGLDTANTGYAGATAQRPNVSGDPNQGAKTIAQWFNTAAFTAPAFGTYGNSHAFLIQSDAIRRTDLSVYKRFLTYESQMLDVRVEFFNLPNTVSFGSPKVNFQSAGSFGTVTKVAVSARQIQLALRYTF